jgi:hypothetical protein
MPIDLSKLTTPDSADTVLHPRDIFSALPSKHASYQYPRDVQAEVWNAWFAVRDHKDVVLKMNTGSGKTVVGYTILKSCLNEHKGPAVYVTPDPYLTGQVLAEGEALGIMTTTDPSSAAFLAGKAILVVNIYKLINGRSVFGVRQEGAKIPIGSLLIDDVHACLATTEGQFTLTVTAPSSLYDSLFQIFRDDLAQQSPTGVLEVEAHDPGKVILIPFWAWSDKLDRVLPLLHEARNTDEFRFTWPLIKDVIRNCQCVIGGGQIEITSRCLPIEAIPSFTAAKRRIFMSATLADDSVLVTTFDVDPRAARNPLTPSTANDVGDRLILVPQALNPELEEDELKRFVHDLSQRHNTVVIVPSAYRAQYWNDVAALTLTANNLSEGVGRLKAGHVGLVVIVNKYDGIDLPGDACRVLVLDGLPDVRRSIDRIEEAALHGTREYLAQIMQRIEQGMGRGVRSSEDRCVVFLMGRSLTKQLYVDGAIHMFTPATRAQFDLSQRIGEQVRGRGIVELQQAVDLLINRDQEWVRLSKGALVQVRYDGAGKVSTLAEAERNAFNAAQRGDAQAAVNAMQEAVNSSSDPRVRGWLRQQLAEYTNVLNPVEAQLILHAGLKENRLLLRPHSGIGYQRLRSVDRAQAPQAADYIVTTAQTGNDLLVNVYGQLEALRFVAGTARSFERSFAWLGQLIGHASQQPETEFGLGPDVLWAVGHLDYFVAECKNGVTNGIISKHDADQLTGSMNWFADRYDSSCGATPLLIHPTNVLDGAAFPHADTRVITIEKLADLKEAVRSYARAIATGTFPPSEGLVGDLLVHHRLGPQAFLDRYTVSPKRSR